MARKPRPAVDPDNVVLGRFPGSDHHGMRTAFIAHQSPVDDYSPRVYLTKTLNDSERDTDAQTIVIRPEDLPAVEAAVQALKAAMFVVHCHASPSCGEDPEDCICTCRPCNAEAA